MGWIFSVLVFLIVCVVFTVNCSFHPTTSAHPESVLIHPREIHILWSQTVKQSEPNSRDYQGKVSEVLAYRVQEHNKTI